MAIVERPNTSCSSDVSTTSASEHVAHHFESAQQQFDACKLGMWLFLVTEVLFFSGLFVAYAVYRANHPEVFVDAHKYLNTTLGAFNTIVLLVSSLTMAMAVRSAQLEQKRLLIWLLGITLACASLFLGVKAVEYSHKWGNGLLWAKAFEVSLAAEPDVEQIIGQTRQALLVLSTPALAGLTLSLASCLALRRGGRRTGFRFAAWILTSCITFFAGVAIGQVVESFSHNTHADQAVESHSLDGSHDPVDHASLSTLDNDVDRLRITGVFFSIYYIMTGIHAVHILCGMGVIAWLLWKAIRFEFNRFNFGPVDFVGLYWHLVDLVWIYLFPLLYLIR